MSRLDARFMTSAGYASRSAARTTAEVPAAALGSWLLSAACAGCISVVGMPVVSPVHGMLQPPLLHCSTRHAIAIADRGGRQSVARQIT